MKEQDPQPLVPVTDEVMEARIVAWVLGEASAFEIAELERLCAEQPELAVFHRRMLALQGLLEEAVSPVEDAAEWQLSAARRGVVEEAIGGAVVPSPATVMTAPRRPLRDRAWLRPAMGLAACLAVTAFAWKVFVSGEDGGFLSFGSRPARAMPVGEVAVDYKPAAGGGMEESRKALSRQIRLQEDLVEEQRKALSQIVRLKPAIARLNSEFTDFQSEAAVKLEETKIALESQLKVLLEKDGDQLLTYAAGLDLPENTVKTLYPQYLETRRELEAAKEKGGDGSGEEIKRLEQLADRMKKDLDSGVVNMRDVMQARLEMTDAQLGKLAAVEDRAEEAVERQVDIDSQDYAAAKKDFEDSLSELAAMKKQYVEQGLQHSRANTATPAKPASRMARTRTVPAKEQNITLAGNATPVPSTPAAAPAAPAALEAPAEPTMGTVALEPPPPPPPTRDGASSRFTPMTEGLRSGDQAIIPGILDGMLNGSDSLAKSEQAEAQAPVDSFANAGAPAVDATRRSLYMAEGNFNLGKYDDAKKEYEKVLREDPTNAAARSGLERIASAKSDYYRAAYDHSRSELLMEVDRAWELQPAKDAPGAVGKGMADSAPVADAPAQQRVPVAELDLGEISAAAEPFSTFSLDVGASSFLLALAALERGETPAPDSIKVEQFYNAVDYGDPAPAEGEPVAGVVEQSAHPVIPGRNLIRMGIRTATSGRTQSQPLRLTLLIDQSGSMVREDRRQAMAQAIADLGKLLTAADRVTVIGFSRTPRLLAESQPGDRLAELQNLLNPEAAEGGTNLEHAMRLANELALRQRLEAAQNRIVLFTDGAANLGDAKPEHLSLIVSSMRANGLAFDVAGIGTEGLNDRLLAEMARHGNGRYYVAGSDLAAQLAGAFRPAAADVKVQVKFNPGRVSRYKLIGFEESRLNTEDFRNDAVDAAELAAEESAVALYQVELIPGGEGPVGEMSVRFRDTSTAAIVERSWSIPHDEGTPVFARATPSIQLAGLSMLAAEKLRGGPLAQAIDFRTLSSSIARVRDHYSSSPRIADMIRLIQLLNR